MFCLLSSCWYLSWIWVSNPYRLALFLGCPCCVPLHVGAWWLLPPDRGFHSWTCLCPLVNARFSFCVQVPLIKRRRVRFLPGSKFLLGSCLILIYCPWSYCLQFFLDVHGWDLRSGGSSLWIYVSWGSAGERECSFVIIFSFSRSVRILAFPLFKCYASFFILDLRSLG